MPASRSTTSELASRVHKLDWHALGESLFTQGFALTPVLLNEQQCCEVAGMFNQADLFRSVTDMGKKRFGSGIYKYFKYPLPEPVAELRAAFYPHLAPIANRFNEALNLKERFPDTLDALLLQCKKAGQSRPTPLLLHYEQGDFNCMHQDIYGELTFPLQITAFLSQRGKDYEGGEFLIQEQMMRMQSRVHAIKPERGQVILFTTRHRPEPGARGYRRVNVKHGVATIEKGRRDTLGIIFHDAQ